MNLYDRWTSAPGGKAFVTIGGCGLGLLAYHGLPEYYLLNFFVSLPCFLFGVLHWMMEK